MKRSFNIIMALASIHQLDAQYGNKFYYLNEKNLYGSLMFETNFTQQHNLSVGLSVNHDYLGQRTNVNVIPYASIDGNHPYILPEMQRLNEKETTPGAYAQYTYTLGSKLTAMAGVRLDHSSIYGNFFTPRFHLKYSPVDAVSIRLSAGKGYRTVFGLAEYNYLLASGRELQLSGDGLKQEDAWNKIIDHRPDIILSDVMMPVMDGNELCRQVKENDETASIPFVMLTARLADEHRKEGLMSGADEYITKPFNIDMLNLRLKNLLNLVKRTGTVAKPTGEVVKEKQLNNGHFVLGTADQKLIEDIDNYIRDNLSNPDTSVESMSAHLCISRVQLYKRMISLMGITPSEYLRAKRIKYAEHLLHSNEYNISEIAYKVGFNNPRYFSKYFQEAYGVTPSQYKKNLEAQE